jgi:Fe2+ transport system protein B
MKYWDTELVEQNRTNHLQYPNSSQTVWGESANSSESVETLIKKALDKELETVRQQFETKESELKKEIEQRDSIITIKDNQTQKYALSYKEEKREKEEWIEKYENSQDEIKSLTKRFYGTKMYLVIFIFLSLFLSIFLLFLSWWAKYIIQHF